MCRRHTHLQLPKLAGIRQAQGLTKGVTAWETQALLSTSQARDKTTHVAIRLKELIQNCFGPLRWAIDTIQVSVRCLCNRSKIVEHKSQGK